MWEISKKGYFTSSEKQEFIDKLICLVPWDNDLDELFKKMEKRKNSNEEDTEKEKNSNEEDTEKEKDFNKYDTETEKWQTEFQIMRIIYKKKSVIKNSVENLYWKTRGKFYARRLWADKSCFEQYVFMNRWEKRWTAVMETVSKA